MIIIDNFIKDLDFLERIEKSDKFWERGYQWYDGWWNLEPNTLRHHLIKAIWGPNSPHPGISCLGFEHWVGDFTETSESFEQMGREYSLKLHFDKDEDYWKEHKTIIGPKIGTVFYPCKEINEMEGGMLYYWENYDSTKLTPEGWLTEPEDEPEIIKAKFNRLIIFDASKLHGVSKVTKGRRRAIAINLWDKKPLEFVNKDY